MINTDSEWGKHTNDHAVIYRHGWQSSLRKKEILFKGDTINTYVDINTDKIKLQQIELVSIRKCIIPVHARYFKQADSKLIFVAVYLLVVVFITDVIKIVTHYKRFGLYPNQLGRSFRSVCAHFACR